MKITGQDLIKWGFQSGPWFSEALKMANKFKDAGESDDTIFMLLKHKEPEPVKTVEMLANPVKYQAFLTTSTDGDSDAASVENIKNVRSDMDALMRTPTIRHGAIMPDACPAGTIPVGAIVATENAIHPGFHSADVCCSMAISVLKNDEDVAKVLDSLQKIAHFGPMKRDDHPAKPSTELMSKFEGNIFLKGLENVAHEHFTTQGDGNHFYFVGHLESTGQMAIVSHHGSRGLGAQLYKRGMQTAHRNTRIHAPKAPKGVSWITADTDEGRAYWDALQVVRLWTKENHYAVHDLLIESLGNKVEDRFWNEHNFVFRKPDGLFYHAKGATPSYSGFSPDDDGRTLIPMNMAKPILITNHNNNNSALGFAPHGAGRNMSRTQFKRENKPSMPEGIDVRFYCGIPDPSELPEAYKDADSIVAAIKSHSLATISDRIMPAGSMMAGDWEEEAPWRVKARNKKSSESDEVDSTKTSESKAGVS